MTNERGMTDEEQLDEDLLFVLKEMDKGLETIDQAVNIHTPNIEWFQNLVVEEKQELKKKLIFDISLFAILAILILSVILFALYSVPKVFFMIQGLAVISVVTFVSVQYAKQVRET